MRVGAVVKVSDNVSEERRKRFGFGEYPFGIVTKHSQNAIAIKIFKTNRSAILQKEDAQSASKEECKMLESLGLWTDHHWDLYDPPAEGGNF